MNNIGETLKQFFIVFWIVFLIQLPNWYFILSRESGGINDFGNENWIIVSDWISTIFSFPIFFFLNDKINNYGLAFFIYVIDLVLISVTIHLIIKGAFVVKKGILGNVK